MPVFSPSILLISPGFAADETDSTCIPPLQSLVRGLVQIGVRVEIIALQYPFHQAPYIWCGARVWPCGGKNRRYRFFQTYQAAVKIAAMLDSNGELPPVAHSFWLGQAWLVGESLRRKYGLNHFTTLMGQDVLWSANWPWLLLLRPNTARRLVAISAVQHARLKSQTGFDPGYRIGWGVESFALPDPGRLPRLVLGVGSLTPVKNWLRWLRVFHQAQNRVGGLQGEIIGEGPQKDRLNAEIQRLKLSDCVKLVGSIPHDAVMARMCEAGVLLHTANYEGYGMVLAEAAACGVVVVGTPVGILHEVGFSGNDDHEMIDLLLKALEGKLKPRQPANMRQTIGAYLQLWKISAPTGAP